MMIWESEIATMELRLSFGKDNIESHLIIIFHN